MNEYVEAIWNGTHMIHIWLLKATIFRKIAGLKMEYVCSKEPIPFKDVGNLELKPLHRGKRWGELYDCGWVHVTGEIPKGANKNNVRLYFNPMAESALIDADTGCPVQGGSNILGMLDAFGIRSGKKFFDLPTDNLESGKIDLWLELGFNGFMGKTGTPPTVVACCLAEFNPDREKFFYDYLTVFFWARGRRDGHGRDRRRLLYALNKAMLLYRVNLPRASAILAEVMKEPSTSDVTAIALGHSHLDLAWLWPMRETRRKAGRTFATALRLIDKFPNYVFGASEAQQYAWVKEDYPALYSRIKAAVASGRIEPLGSMWVEPDINLSGGESIIRQIAYGLEFFQKEFGLRPDVCWLPDVFGFSGALPQILQGCGVNNFMSIKLSWNKFHTFPHTSFVWQGIDGSEVLVNMPPEGVYASDAAPYALKRAMRQSKDDPSVVKEILIPFGPGDGGAGAGDIHLELINREGSLAGLPKVKTGTSAEFFARLQTRRDKLPRYKGELYLEAHQGTYTSQVQQKWHNRYCERQIHKIEFLDAVSSDKPLDLEKQWKDILLQQFHDILPGTSVKRVHDESLATYLDMEKELDGTLSGLLSARTSAGGVSAINYSPCPEKEWIFRDGKFYLCQLAPYSAAPLSETTPDLSALSFGEDFLSNGKLTARFGEHGDVVSLKDENGKEYASERGLGKLTFYRDKKLFWNASDMDWNYINKRLARPVLLSHRTYSEGASVVRENKYRFGSTKITQRVFLSLDKEYLEFSADIDFQSPLKMLRADFFPSEFSDTALCNVQFGNIERSTKKEDFAQFEVSAHKWVDVSNDNFGTAVLCDSRHGYRAKDGLISLCLVRGTVFPGKRGGCGKHSVRYAFYPHRGTAAESRLVELGYAFNYPPETTDGAVSLDAPFELSCDNVLCETVKNGDGCTVYRLYEAKGKAADCVFRVKGAKELTLADLLERPVSEPQNSEEIALRFEPYKIVTVLAK